MATQVHDSRDSRARSICRSILDAIIDPILLFDPQTFRIIDINKKATELYGYSRKELLSKRLQDLTTDVPTYADILHPPPGLEATHFTRSGDKLDFLISLSLIQYWGHKAVLSINRDIRDLKRIQSAVSANEKKFRVLIQNVSEIVALIDPQGIIRFISPQADRILGLPAAEVIGRNVFDFIHPQDQQRAHEEYAKTVREPGEAVPSILKFRDATGNWVPLEIIANNQIQEPEIAGVIFTARDLRYRRELETTIRRADEALDRRVEERTMELARANAALRLENRQRRYTERQLQESVSLLNATLESTADGILVVSTDRSIRSFNHKFVEMWHIPDAALSTMDDETLLRWAVPQLENPDAFHRATAALYESPDETSVDRLELRDGRVFERYSQPQKVASKITGRVWSFRDVTQAEWLQEELRQAQKMEAVGRLAGGVAHDFNNILMLIAGYVAQLQEQPDLSEPAMALCKQLSGATSRAAALTRQLLAFSRKNPVTPQVVELNGIVSDLEKVLPRLISEPVRLRTSLQSGHLPVFADRAQMELMIVNLALNARDAMPQGGTLSITTKEETLESSSEHSAGPKRFVVLEVRDTGHGMMPDISAHIFEPFFTTKEIGKGSGLGLSTVYGIVEQAGGHITVDSEPDCGTSFRIYFPRADAPIAKDQPEILAPPGQGQETILLVEDEEGIRMMTRTYLQSLGYEVLEAGNGAQALRISRQHEGPIDLLVADIVMPEMKGDELARVIRRERPRIIAIFMSGYANVQELDPTIRVVEKPFAFPELGREIRQALDAKKPDSDHERRAS